MAPTSINHAIFQPWVRPWFPRLISKELNLQHTFDLSPKNKLPALLNLICMGRIAHTKLYDEDNCRVATMAEILSPVFSPSDLFLDENKSKREIILAAIRFQNSSVMMAKTTATEKTWFMEGFDLRFQIALNKEKVTSELNYVHAVIFYKHVLNNLCCDWEVLSLKINLSAYVSILKQGLLNQETKILIRKIEDNISRHTKTPVKLNDYDIHEFYVKYGKYINESNVSSLLSYLQSVLPNYAFCSELMSMKMSCSGLLSFETIGRAMKLFPTFPWCDLASLITEQFINYSKALDIVNGNRYYGYRKDLGLVRPSRYHDLGYVAKQLMNKIAGENLGVGFRWSKLPRMKFVVDRIVYAYQISGRQEPYEVDDDVRALVNNVLEKIYDSSYDDIFLLLKYEAVRDVH